MGNKGTFILEREDLLGSIKFLITGFYGLGLCGFLTTKFFYDAAKNAGSLKRIGYFWSRNLPPVVEVSEDGLFFYPVELYKISDNAGIMILRYQLHTSLHFDVADILTNIIKEKGITLILAGGIDVNAFPPNDPEGVGIVYTSNNRFYKDYIEGNPAWKYRKSPSGIIVSGGIAILLMYSEMKNIPAVSLLAPTQPKAGNMDYLASLELAKSINEVFKIGLNFEDIEKEIRSQIMETLVQLKEAEPHPVAEEEETTPEEYDIT